MFIINICPKKLYLFLSSDSLFGFDRERNKSPMNGVNTNENKKP